MVATYVAPLTPGVAIAAANAALLMALALSPSTAVPLAAVAILVPLGLALAKRPQRGILLLAALIPFDGLLLLAPELPPVAAGWKEALVLATLVATFVAPRAARRPAPTRMPGWAPAVAGLLLLGMASALAVGGLQAVWGLKIAFFFLLAAVVIHRCPLSEAERDRLVTILWMAGVVTSLYGLAQQFLGHGRLHALGYEYNSAIRFTGRWLRSFSSFDNPFGFGFFLMLVLLLVVPHGLAEPGRTRTRMFWLSMPVLLLGLGTSFVRGAWIGLAIGLGYMAWTRFRVLLLAVPAALVVVVLLPTGISSAAFSAKSGGQRVEAWDANLAAISSHPLGVGLGSSNAAAEKVSAATSPRGGAGGREVFHPDNEYYRAVYELGVVGLWLTVLLFVSAFLAARDAASKEGGRRSVFALGVSAAILAVAAAATVTTYFDVFPNNVYFWILLAAAAPGARRSLPVRGPTRQPVPAHG